MVAEPLSALSALTGVVASAARGVLQVTDLVQVPDEVTSSTAFLRASEKHLGELIALQKENRDLLSKRPTDAMAVEQTIAQAWSQLQSAKPVLERCGFNAGGATTSLGRRLRWKFYDRSHYRLIEMAVQRNDADVRDQIKRLQQMVYFSPLETLAETAREEERRRRRQLEDIRARRELEAFGFLDSAMRSEPLITTHAPMGSECLSASLVPVRAQSSDALNESGDGFAPRDDRESQSIGGKTLTHSSSSGSTAVNPTPTVVSSPALSETAALISLSPATWESDMPLGKST